MAEWPLQWPLKTPARLAKEPCGASRLPNIGGHVTNACPARPHQTRQTKKSAGRRGRPALWGSGESGGGLAATTSAGSGCQGDAELGQLLQVEAAFVGGAEFILGDGAPVGFCGQPPNTI